MEHRQPRVGLEILVRLHKKDSEICYNAKILDISERGLKIYCKNWERFKSFNEGDFLKFETYEEFYKINGVGKIIWISKDHDMAGVDFVEIDNDSKIMLKEFIEVCVK